MNAGRDRFDVTLVAYTRAHIVLPTRAVGDRVNVEVDVLGKYVERQMAYRDAAAAHGAPAAGGAR